jgi:hydrogenase expression/formation protein HypC
MCLAIPAKVISLTGAVADVDIMGNRTSADISVLSDVKVGDYILVHAGFAIQKYSDDEAAETLALINEILDKADQ